MLDYLAELEVPTIVALTKMDKLSKAAARERATEIARQLGLQSEQVIPFSAQSGEGRVELLEAITELVEAVPEVDSE
jgi:GTP-binding protein